MKWKTADGGRFLTTNLTSLIIDMGLFKLSVSSWVSFGVFKESIHFQKLLNLLAKIVHGIPFLSFNVYRLCSILISLISYIDNYVFSHITLISLPRVLKILLNFSKIKFLVSLIFSIVFSILLISVLIFIISFFYLIWT